MFKPIKALFKLNQVVALPGDTPAAGVVAEIKTSVFSEPSYFVVPVGAPCGWLPAQWHWQSHLVAAMGTPEPTFADAQVEYLAAHPTPMQKLRARRKSKR